jgi:hypothetical protein
VNIRNLRKGVSSLNNRSNVISNKKIVSEYNSDSLGNVTRLNDTFLGETGLRTNSDSGTAVGQFGSRNQTVWSHYPTRDVGAASSKMHAHVTEHSVRKKRSAIATKSDINIRVDSSSVKNERQLRAHKFIVSNKNRNYFGKLWKSLISQDNTFIRRHNIRDSGGIQERALLQSTAIVNGNLAQKRGKRSTEGDSGNTMTEENSVLEPDLHFDITSSDTDGDKEPEQCLAPEYIVYTWVLCLVALATALKLYYLVKTTLASAMVSVFTTLILVAYKDVFDEE